MFSFSMSKLITDPSCICLTLEQFCYRACFQCLYRCRMRLRHRGCAEHPKAICSSSSGFVLSVISQAGSRLRLFMKQTPLIWKLQSGLRTSLSHIMQLDVSLARYQLSQWTNHFDQHMFDYQSLTAKILNQCLGIILVKDWSGRSPP